MKKTLSVAMVFLLGIGAIGDALADRVHYRSRVGVGVVIGPYWGPWYYPPHPYYYPPYYPPVVIEQPAPPVYIEQQPMETATPSGYWYYCQSPEGYYPDVRECPGGWLKVLPRPQSGR
ncbi:hypothetical protein [Propionivibrio sp.]|jgi:hypothetical protein|uniref:hypothetical protein n=1 Tax=Propionivibrio sp. TaxID=2212460 RepID=UPI00272E4168|nr:hypothetical protein [Propionivibrio sp.]